MTVGERELLIHDLRKASLQDLLIIERELKKELNRKLTEEEDR